MRGEELRQVRRTEVVRSMHTAQITSDKDAQGLKLKVLDGERCVQMPK